MGIVDKLFKSQINKAANELLATQFARQYANELGALVEYMKGSLPTINPDGADYHNIFKTIGAVYETTDLISKKVIGSPFVFYRVKDRKQLGRAKAMEKSDPVQAFIAKALAIEEVDDTSLTRLLDNPNPYQTGTQFLWTVCLSYLLTGNTYIHATRNGKKAIELYCFPNMKINASDADLLDPIKGYILNNTSQKPFAIDEIYHIKTGNPAAVDRTFEYLYGVSPLRAYLEPIRTIREAKTQSSKQAKNGGVFGILSPKDKEDQLEPEQKQQLKDKMTEARRSDDEMARVFPSTIALQWQSIGLPVGDLKLLELVSANEEDIYRAFHVPLQYHNQKASTSNNQSTAVKQLVYDAVAPNCEAIGNALTRFIGPGFGDIIIELDYTQLPEMAVNMGEVAKYLAALPKGILTPNEQRSVLRWGEKSEAYMNEHYVDAGLTTLKRVYEGTSDNNNIPGNDQNTNQN